MPKIAEDSDSSNTSSDSEDEEPAELENSKLIAIDNRKRRNTVNITGSTANAI